MMIHTDTDTLTSRQSIAFCHELGFLVKEHSFYNAVTRGYLRPIDPEAEGKLFARADILAYAEEQKKIAQFITPKQILERIHKQLPSYQYPVQVTRLIRSGRLKQAYEAEGKAYYDPADVDALIPVLIREERQRQSAEHLMETKQAWRWINRQLELSGRPERISLDCLYNWVDTDKVPVDRKVPGKNGIFQSWRFSETSLRQAPIFQVPPLMPDDKAQTPEPVLSTGRIVHLQAEWGELLTRRGVKDADLSVHAISSKKKRKIRPVATIGNNLLFPRRYIPRKKHRKLREVIDL